MGGKSGEREIGWEGEQNKKFKRGEREKAQEGCEVVFRKRERGINIKKE